MGDTLISVIVPIYNSEKYLNKCIQSLVNQTYKRIEIILVNDGSTDMSGKICDDYAQTDKRIKVIHKENGGIASARNCGMKISGGEYISFVDADDFLDLDTYESIYKIIKKENPDCIDYGWKYINDYGDITANMHKLEKNSVLGKNIIEEIILPPLLNLKKDEEHFIFDFVWNKIYKREILISNKINFDESRKTWEDRVFLVKYMKCCNTFYSMDKCFYNYVSVLNSLSRRYDLQFFELILQNYRSYVEWFGDEYNFDTQYVYNYWCHSIENMILRSLKEKDKRDEIRKNIERTLTDNQVVIWYKNREPENELERQTSNLVADGKVQDAIELYERQAMKQIKEEKRQKIKAKLYAVRKVFK